ncbi:MAG: hypothetical protein LBV13_02830 [Methanomassiliicoccaceae archaeon]|jgi:hypothetical protein|nr:hypothetical protein [Methanomassiliicoccaceae archaeon]
MNSDPPYPYLEVMVETRSGLMSFEEAKENKIRTFGGPFVYLCEISGKKCMGFRSSDTSIISCGNCNMPVLYPDKARELLEKL